MKPSQLSRAIRISLIYGVFSVLWIVITDQLTYAMARPPVSATVISIAKGTLFVLLSTLLIYLLLRADERSEASLRTEVDHLQDSFSFLFADNPLPMWIVEPDSMQLLAVNPAALQMFGYTREAFLAHRASDLLVADELPLLHKALIYPTQELRRSGPWRMVTQEGRIFYAYVLAVNIDYSGHKSNLDVAIDISEQKQIEEKLEKTANERNDFEAFSFSVSHDLRAPLRAISGYEQILMEEYGAALDEQGRDYLEKMRLASKSMNQTIDDLLILSGLTHQEPNFELLNLSQIALEIIEQLRREAPERKVTFLCQPQVLARADRSFIRIALYNLLENAWKFTSRKAEAQIEFGCLTAPENRCVFFLKDNGVGFDEALATRMFKPFERFHPATEFSGSGLGLSVVARTIERHNGKVWAEGHVDEGATFYFTLGMDGEQLSS